MPELHDGLDLTPVGTDTRHVIWRQTAAGSPIGVLTGEGLDRLCSNIGVARPFTRLPRDLVEVLTRHIPQANPPTSPSRWEFHFLSLLWSFPAIGFRRSDLSRLLLAFSSAFESYRWEDGQQHREWFPAYDVDSDPIQHVNKTSQWGVEHSCENLARPFDGRIVTYYFITLPLRPNSNARNLKAANTPIVDWTPPALVAPPPAPVPAAAAGPTKSRIEVLTYLAATWTAVMERNWTPEGHRDPDNKVSGGLCWQPKAYNRAQRDRFKFDEYGLPRCPAVGHLSRHLRDFYPSDNELQRLRRAIDEELGTREADDDTPHHERVTP